MTKFSIEAATEMSLADEGRDSLGQTPPPPSLPDEADEESEMRRWTAEAFTPTRATKVRKPLFGS
jgi:hypothetical protein